MYEVTGIDGRVALLPGHTTMITAAEIVGRIANVRRLK